jgi:hypothetical protein
MTNKIPQEIEEKILKEWCNSEMQKGFNVSIEGWKEQVVMIGLKSIEKAIYLAFEEGQKQTNEEVLKLIDEHIKKAKVGYCNINCFEELKSKLSGGKE